LFTKDFRLEADELITITKECMPRLIHYSLPLFLIMGFFLSPKLSFAQVNKKPLLYPGWSDEEPIVVQTDLYSPTRESVIHIQRKILDAPPQERDQASINE
jgi:hypothetical protein